MTPAFPSRWLRRAANLLATVWLPLWLLSPAHAAISVTDDSGATVTLAHPARRVVSLAPNITELLFAAGGGTHIVGAVTYSDYPPQARRIPRVGGSGALDLERIAALKPDLVVVWQRGNEQQQIDTLKQLGLPLFYSEPRHLADIPGELARLGALLGTSATAHAAASDFQHRYDALRSTYANRPPVTVFYQVWQHPLMTLNGTHIVSDVIRLCGGRNVFADLAPLVPTVSTEAVIAANPEAMFTATTGATASDKPLAGLDMWRKWPRLTAVARGNLFSIDGDWINRPGPRILEGAKAMCADLDIARQHRSAN